MKKILLSVFWTPSKAYRPGSKISSRASMTSQSEASASTEEVLLDKVHLLKSDKWLRFENVQKKIRQKIYPAAQPASLDRFLWCLSLLGWYLFSPLTQIMNNNSRTLLRLTLQPSLNLKKLSKEGYLLPELNSHTFLKII